MALLATALMQWLGVGERIHHAIWQWYKFADYGGGGHTTVGYSAVLLTFTLSAVAISLCCLIYKNTNDVFVSVVTKYSSYSLVLGLASLSTLLISPIGQLVQR
jgi:hypothetical protein